MNPQTLDKLRNLSEQIARELVFAEAGTDAGLLPVNSLLGQIQELLGDDPELKPLVEAAVQARRALDKILESGAIFSAQDLQWLREWATDWQVALSAQEQLPGARNEATPPAVHPKPVEAQPAPQAAEPVLVLKLQADRDLLTEFLIEAEEHLGNIESGVLVLEAKPTDAETLDAIFRAFHTFKGNAGFLNLTPIQLLAHELESLLESARKRILAVTPEIISLILEGGDALKAFTREIGSGLAGTEAQRTICVPILPLVKRIRAVLAAEAPAVSEPAASAPPITREAESNSAGQKTSSALSAVKVDTHKLDSLVELVGEMVIAQSLLVQHPMISALQNEQLVRDLAQLGRITREIQHTAMSLRMVPIRATFQKMHRLVRDLSVKVGKRVQLTTEGEDTELDRTLVEEISDPLIHMIRNSVDHGIEKPETRLARGKADQGTIALKAYHQGGNIVIELRDDGNGLDRERILPKAIEQGLADPTEPLSDADVFQFILAPGFSTAQEVTDLSGRGVGMDVVRRNIEKLRGKIEIQSQPGAGVIFRIYLPLTLAIIDALLVGVGEHRYILPTLLVRESFRPTAEMLSRVHGRGEMVNVRGRLRPLLRLYAHLGIKPESTDPTQSIVLILEAGNDVRGVLVDRLMGKQEVVIKALGETFSQSRCLAGAAILGDGRVGLILDPHALVHLESEPLAKAA